MSATPTNGHADSENIGNGQGGFKGKARDYATGAGLRGDEGVVYGSPRQHTTGVFAGKVMRYVTAVIEDLRRSHVSTGSVSTLHSSRYLGESLARRTEGH